MNIGVLLCGELELPDVAGKAPVAMVTGLCNRPAAAADAMRALGVSRVVLGLCGAPPTRDLLAALRGAGAEPFGIEAVMLSGHEPEAPVLLTAGVAKLAQLAAGEHGRAILAGGEVSRRALFSRHAMLDQAPIAILDQEACIGSLRCGVCSTYCPVGAIDASAPFPTIDADACTACGACVGPCPAGALRLSGCSTVQIEAQLEPLLGHVDGVVFACRHTGAAAPPGWALVELPSLALLTPAWILHAWGRATQVRLAPCDQPSCTASAEVVELAELITTAAGSPPDASPDPPRLGEPRGTVDAVLALVRDGEPFKIAHRASPTGMLELDADRCTLCGACAIVCPTAALALEDGDSASVLKHDPRVCMGCDHCTAVCPEHALTVTPGIDVARLRAGTVELMQAGHVRCMVCGDQLPPVPMRRRMRELLPSMAGAPLDLCAACALKSRSARTTAGNHGGPAGSHPIASALQLAHHNESRKDEEDV